MTVTPSGELGWPGNRASAPAAGGESNVGSSTSPQQLRSSRTTRTRCPTGLPTEIDSPMPFSGSDEFKCCQVSTSTNGWSELELGDYKGGTMSGSGAQRVQTTRRWWVLVMVCMAMFMAVLDSTSVYAALPVIAHDLGFAPAEIQWVITAYGVTVGGLLLLGGRLTDHLGRRRVFMGSVTVFATASLGCGLATSSEILILTRVLQGGGAAVMTPAGLSILMDAFPTGQERNRALGIWGGLGGIGASAGLLLGGVLTDCNGPELSSIARTWKRKP